MSIKGDAGSQGLIGLTGVARTAAITWKIGYQGFRVTIVLTKITISFLWATILSGSAFANPITNGLVAFYKFQGNANDLSGFNHNGTFHGGTFRTDQNGSPASAFHLNGTSDYILFGKVLPDMRQMTVLTWAYSEGGGYNFINDADWANGNDVIFTFAGNRLGILGTKGSNSLDKTWTVPIQFMNTWRHLAYTLSESNSAIYVDGVLQAFVNKGAANVGYHNFIIGTHEYPQGTFGWNGYWKGAISELRIYDRVLSTDEIDQIYRETQKGALPPLRIRISEVAVEWESVLGVTYEVDYSSAATPNIWTPLTKGIVGNGSTIQVFDKILPGEMTRFYKLLSN